MTFFKRKWVVLLHSKVITDLRLTVRMLINVFVCVCYHLVARMLWMIVAYSPKKSLIIYCPHAILGYLVMVFNNKTQIIKGVGTRHTCQHTSPFHITIPLHHFSYFSHETPVFSYFFVKQRELSIPLDAHWSAGFWYHFGMEYKGLTILLKWITLKSLWHSPGKTRISAICKNYMTWSSLISIE